MICNAYYGSKMINLTKFVWSELWNNCFYFKYIVIFSVILTKHILKKYIAEIIRWIVWSAFTQVSVNQWVVEFPFCKSTIKTKARTFSNMLPCVIESFLQRRYWLSLKHQHARKLIFIMKLDKYHIQILKRKNTNCLEHFKINIKDVLLKQKLKLKLL